MNLRYCLVIILALHSAFIVSSSKRRVTFADLEEKYDQLCDHTAESIACSTVGMALALNGSLKIIELLYGYNLSVIHCGVFCALLDKHDENDNFGCIPLLYELYTGKVATKQHNIIKQALLLKSAKDIEVLKESKNTCSPLVRAMYNIKRDSVENDSFQTVCPSFLNHHRLGTVHQKIE